MRQLSILLPLAMILLVFSCASTRESGASNQEQVNNIPLPTDPDSLDKDTLVLNPDTLPDSLALAYPDSFKSTYRIAFFLPLYANDYEYLDRGKKRVADIAFDYWYGAKIALDTLREIGFNATVDLIDTQNDSTKIVEALNNRDKPDLMFGTMFGNNLRFVDRYTDTQHINIISPLSTLESCMQTNDRMFFSTAGEDKVLAKSVEVVRMQYDTNFPIIIYCPPGTSDQAWGKKMAELLSDSPSVKPTVKVLDSRFISKGSLQHSLPDSAYVIICSDNESFVTSVIAEVRRSLKNIRVLGREDWLKFKSIDVEAWERLSMHFIVTRQVDYCHPLTKAMVRNYRERYKEEPSEYAVIGYAETLYYLLYLHNFGLNFQRYCNELDIDLPHRKIKLEQDPDCKYFRNSATQVMRFENLQLIQVE